jgi:hypothetical protein
MRHRAVLCAPCQSVRQKLWQNELSVVLGWLGRLGVDSGARGATTSG